jgi:uncharacterized protein YbjT (DUF2867 family)
MDSSLLVRDKPMLVFGASGYIGSWLIPYLIKDGRRVRAVSRNADVLRARRWPDVEVMSADALRPESLAPALAGVQVAYYLVHSMAAGRDFGDIDRRAAECFAQAADDAGVEHIIYLGGLVPDDADSEHIVSRKETGEVLRQGSVPVTEVRAGIIVGPGSAAFEVMRDLVFHLPIMLTPRWVRAQSPPIALDNLLEYLARLPELAESRGRTFDAAGPETLDYETMMQILAEEAGRRAPWILPVPVLTPKLSSYWLKLVTSVPTPVARALIEGLKHDFSADDADIRRLVPQQLLGFRDSVRSVFAAERELRVQSRWTEGAFQIRGARLEHAYYAKRAGAQGDIEAPIDAVWDVICRIGGDNGYFAYEWMWHLREIMDWMVGGHGLKRGRRHPTELRLGDRVDAWRVVAIDAPRSLTLQFGLRAPGAGVLEFVLDSCGEGKTRLEITAYWHPRGVWGLLYWGAMYPAHVVLFKGMVAAIGKRATHVLTEGTSAS